MTDQNPRTTSKTTKLTYVETVGRIRGLEARVY